MTKILDKRQESFGAASNLAAALNSEVEIDNAAGYAGIAMSVTIPTGGTVVFEGTLDDSTWEPISLKSTSTNGFITSLTSNAILTGSIAGFLKVRVRVSVAGSVAGTVIGTIQKYAHTIEGIELGAPHSYRESVAEGQIEGHENRVQFGRNPSTAATIEPISLDAIYRTPIALTSLELVSDDANDTAAGTGAQSVKVTGLSTDYEEVSEIVAMNGITAVALANQYYRVYDLEVVDSGTYADIANGSHIGNITLQETGGGAVWASISEVSDFPKSKSQIGMFSIPAGKKAYIYAVSWSVENSTAVNLYLFKRDRIDEVVTPFGAMTLLKQYVGVAGVNSLKYEMPIEIDEKTDVGFMGFGAGTPDVSVEIEYFLKDI